ncbi:MAG: hypothetical protein NVS3B10_23570 [Polyangiales bacterium]
MAKVLVVDDEEWKRTELTTALRLVGFDTHGTCSADAAHRVEHASFDVAIIDLMLHGTNGFELARRMRDANPAVRVVLTSAYHFNEHQLTRMDCGAIGFVPQPFALEELAEFLWAKLATPAAV